MNGKMRNSIKMCLLAALVWTSILMEMVKTMEVSLIYHVISCYWMIMTKIGIHKCFKKCYKNRKRKENYMTLLSYLCKMKRQNRISHLVCALGVNCKYTSGYNSGIFQKYSRNIPEYWLLNNLVSASGTDYFRNLRNQKSHHSVCI